MIPMNPARSGVLCGALLMLASSCHAGADMGPITFQDDTSIAPYLKLGFGVKPTPSFVMTIHSEWSQIRVSG